MTPLYLYLDPLFHLTPARPTLQECALEEMGDQYTYTVLWRRDAVDNLDNLDQAVALAVAKACEHKEYAVVKAARRGGLSSAPADDAWDDRAIFAAGPSKHHVQRAVRR